MNLNKTDREKAIESLRSLVNGIPIKDDNGELVGYIEKPSLDAIKFVLQSTEGSEWSAESEESE